MKKVKIKSVKRSLGDDSITRIFNQMVGAERADPEIVVPKYIAIRTATLKIAKVLDTAVVDVFSKVFPEQKDCCDEILQFSNELRALEFVEIPEEPFTKEFTDSIADKYIVLKESNTVKKVIIACKTLIVAATAISKNDTGFVNRSPGFNFMPFSFSSLNIKPKWAELSQKQKSYIFIVMSVVLNASKEIYRTITSPDVDVKKFSEVIINSMSKLKKALPRCDKAFRLIQESVDMFEGNFDGYYKDFVQSQNPSTIMESFVIDVSKKGNGDLQTVMQFRKIINHYRKATQGKIKDPRVKKIFAALNEKFQEFDKTTAK